MTTHHLLIFLHAFGGVISFISGCIALIPSLKRNARSTLLSLFLAAQAVLTVALFGVVAYDWPHFVLSQQIIFGGLCLLALYMAWRAFAAYRAFRDHRPGWMQPFADQVGFNLISLFDGFVIISALDLSAPGWLVGVIAVLGVVMGIWATNLVKMAETKRAME
jgi:hypothetical protein